jgi:hypothetical protein
MFDGLTNDTINANIQGVELDPYTFSEIGDQADLIFSSAATHGWERRGDDNLFDEQPWLEGSWMTKYNGKYYLHYAGPGTEFKTYADGIYVADSPLGPYEYATYSPFSFKPTGFICGAGHGSTFKDKDGQYWHIGTMTISVKAMFERRLGLYPVDFDEDGHIHCNTDWGDYPQYFPGVKEDPIHKNFAGMMLLSHKKFVMASSYLEDHGIENAVDEEARTYWAAQTGSSNEWMIVDLGKECDVEAIQVNFAEHGTDPDLVRGRENLLYQQYIIENSLDGLSWDTLIDKSRNLKDVPHDYVQMDQPVTARYIRLSNVYTPGEGNFAVRGLRVFGNSDQAVFTTVADFTVERDMADGRDAIIHWTPVDGADGYIINYGIAPDKLYNNYMVYDTDSVAIHSLNHGVDYYFGIRAFDNGTDYYRNNGEFQSHQSGDWNDVNTWRVYDGTNWTHPVSAVPSVTDGPITILEGHTILVTENDSADQLSVAPGGILEIAENTTFQVKNYIGTDLSVEGTLRNCGNLTTDSMATISFSGDGIYEHKQDGGVIPDAIWNRNSTCVLDSLKSLVPSNGNQSFFNLRWNCPDQTANLSLMWNDVTIGGNITIQNTGSGQLHMCDPEAGEVAEVRLMGDLIQSGGIVAATGTEADNTTITVHQHGNIHVTGGDFSLTRGSQGGNGTTTWNILGNVTLENTSTGNTNSEGATFLFSNKETGQLLSLSGVTFAAGGFPVVVDTAVILDLATSKLEGEGGFHLNSGATLITAHEMGIDGALSITGAKIFDEATNYVFNGSTTQETGALIPDMVNNLTISNNQGVTLTKSISVGGMVDVIEGSLNSGGFALSYQPGASLRYSGITMQTTAAGEFPAVNGPMNLIIANPKSVALHDSRTVHFLDLQRKIDLGSNTLTIDTVSDAAYNAYVITTEGGALKNPSVGDAQAFFPVGVNSYTPVWITNSGTVDALTVGAVNDTVATADGNSVRVIWNISEENPGNGNYTIQFGWPPGLEGAGFREDRENKARIIHLTDTTEAGTGDYTMQFTKNPFTLSRGGITELGPFGIGTYGIHTGMNESQPSLPDGFQLYPNSPNPFSGSTSLRFAIPEASLVHLKIYNLLGEEISDLAGKKYPPGIHTEIFDASLLHGGIYLVVFHVKDYVQTRRMVILD